MRIEKIDTKNLTSVEMCIELLIDKVNELVDVYDESIKSNNIKADIETLKSAIATLQYSSNK